MRIRQSVSIRILGKPRSKRPANYPLIVLLEFDRSPAADELIKDMTMVMPDRLRPATKRELSIELTNRMTMTVCPSVSIDFCGKPLSTWLTELTYRLSIKFDRQPASDVDHTDRAMYDDYSQSFRSAASSEPRSK